MKKNKKEALYKQYPQLIDKDFLKNYPCSIGLNKYLLNIYDRDYQSMWQSSAKMLTDLGMKDNCQNIFNSDESQ